MNNINQIKQVKGEIFNAQGHTDFSGSLGEAMEIIMNSTKNEGKFAYINGNPFHFVNFDQAEQNQVYNLLNESEAPEFWLTNKLAGGAKKMSKRQLAAAKAVATRRAAKLTPAQKAAATRKARKQLYKAAATVRTMTPAQKAAATRKANQARAARGCAAQACCQTTAPAAAKTNSGAVIRGAIVKSTLSQALGNKVPMLGVSINYEGGKEFVDVVVSDLNNAHNQLIRNKEQVLVGIFNALKSETELRAAAQKFPVRRR